MKRRSFLKAVIAVAAAPLAAPVMASVPFVFVCTPKKLAMNSTFGKKVRRPICEIIPFDDEYWKRYVLEHTPGFPEKDKIIQFTFSDTITISRGRIVA